MLATSSKIFLVYAANAKYHLLGKARSIHRRELVGVKTTDGGIEIHPSGSFFS